MPQTKATEGPSVRVLRVGEQVRHVLSEVLMRGDVHDDVLGAHAISVTEVRMSPDLRHATVFIKPLLGADEDERSEEHTSELQSLMRISYAVVRLQKKKTQKLAENWTYDAKIRKEQTHKKKESTKYQITKHKKIEAQTQITTIKQTHDKKSYTSTDT